MLLCSTSATKRCDELVEIFLAVVVFEFFPGFDFARCKDENMATANVHFAIWLTGVVEVASGIRPAAAVDKAVFAGFKQIFAAVLIRFVFRKDRSDIFDDEAAFLDRFHCHHAESGVGFLDLERAMGILVFFGKHI